MTLAVCSTNVLLVNLQLALIITSYILYTYVYSNKINNNNNNSYSGNSYMRNHLYSAEIGFVMYINNISHPLEERIGIISV